MLFAATGRAGPLSQMCTNCLLPCTDVDAWACMCMIVHVVHPPFQWLHCKNVRLCVQVGSAYWFAKGGSTRLAVTEALATREIWQILEAFP